ncbi:MAG: hypothetical protein COC10_11065 [Sphingobium sp.]|nr:MAG: hypothetical protein COC10_11065 [Sphingobium sp.]
MDVAPGLVVAPVLPLDGVPIVRLEADDGLHRVLGFQREGQIWLSDRLMRKRAGTAGTTVNLNRIFASYTGKDPYPVPDLAMFQGRRIALSVLLAEGWRLRAKRAESASLGVPAYVLARRVFQADNAPVTFGWPDPSTQEISDEPRAAAAIQELTTASHVHSLPLTETDGVLSLGWPVIIRLLPASTDGSNAFPLPLEAAVVPLAGQAGFADPTGLYARATAVTHSETPWPSAPDTLVVRAKDLLTEAGQAAVAQVRTVHASQDRAAMDVTQYAQILKGAVSIQIEPLGARVWQVANRGALQTLRFDRKGSFTLDMNRSDGVLGFWSIGPALFVALDPAVETVLVALTTKQSATEARLQAIELVEAGPKLERLQHDGCQTTALIEGSGQVTVRARLKPRVRLAGDRLPVTSLGQGLWQFIVPEPAKAAMVLSVAMGCD